MKSAYWASAKSFAWTNSSLWEELFVGPYVDFSLLSIYEINEFRVTRLLKANRVRLQMSVKKETLASEYSSEQVLSVHTSCYLHIIPSFEYFSCEWLKFVGKGLTNDS